MYLFEPIPGDLEAAVAIVSSEITGVCIHYGNKGIKMDVEQMIIVLTKGIEGIGLKLD